MKLLILLAFLFMASISQAQFRTATLQAAGLTCAMCTKAIHDELKQLAAIESVAPDIKNSQFTIQFKEGSAIDPDALKKAVEDAGFSVAKLRLTGNFSNVKLEKDATS